MGALTNKISAAVLGVVLLALWFSALIQRPLFNPDEGRYAEIPREMLAGGDWVIPQLNGLAYIEKPPLQYWATAALYAVLGPTAFSARLYTTLTAFGTVLVIWWAARRLWTRELALRAATLTVSMLLFILLGQLLTLDMSLSFYMTLCLCAFLVAQVHAEQDRPTAARNAMLLAWGAAALGVLTKGLVAAVIPGAVLVLYSGYTRDLSPWRRLSIGWGLPLFVGLAAPWHVLAERRLEDFVQFFFVREHFARFMTPVSDRQEPVWFFGAVFLVGTLPWTLSAVRALWSGWRRKASAGGFDATVFLWIWVVFIGVFFSLSDSKLIPYLLPALPALAILIAAAPLAALMRDVGHAACLVAGFGVLLMIGAVSLPWLLQSAERAPYFLQLRVPLMVVALLLLGTGAVVWRRRRGDVTRNIVLLGGGAAATVLVLLNFAGVLAPIYSGVTLSAAPGFDPNGAALYSVRTYDQTLPFYWRRSVTLVDYRGELDYGLRHDPALGMAGIEEFQVRWQLDEKAYAVMEPATFDSLRLSGLPMREIARDVHRVLVARR